MSLDRPKHLPDLLDLADMLKQGHTILLHRANAYCGIGARPCTLQGLCADLNKPSLEALPSTDRPATPARASPKYAGRER